MKKIYMVIVSVAIFVIAQTPIEKNGKLYVDKITGKLMNNEGIPTPLRGMSSHGLQWYGGMINETSLRAIQEDWQADVIRLSTYIQEGGYEKMPSTMINFVDSKIEMATKQGLYVIIDFHMLAPGNPLENTEHAIDFFTHMASTHSNKNNIFYEICNEPNNEGGTVLDYYTGKGRTVDTTTVTWEMIKSYADTIVPIIRKYDKENIILVGTPNWCQDVNSVIGNRIDDDNLMYTTHFYAGSHKDYERGNLREALNANIPVFVTEFGTQTYSGDGPNDYISTGKWLALLDSFDISWVNWNFSNHGFSGAVFNKNPSSFSDYEFYIDDNNLKGAGKWIKKELQEPGSWKEYTDIKVLKSNLDNLKIIKNGNSLEINNNKDITSLSIYSLLGKKIVNKTINYKEVKINLEGISRGFYILSIVDLDGYISKSLFTY